MSYQQNGCENAFAFVSPQQLMLHHGQSNMIAHADPPSCMPGIDRHLLYHPNPTPHSVLAGTAISEEHLICFPRRLEYRGNPSFPPITFSVGGRPPYLKDIWDGKVQLDGANDTVFERHGWRLTSWLIDWPGIATNKQRIYMQYAGRPITRAVLARELSGNIGTFWQDARKGRLPYGPQVLSRSQSKWAIKNIRFSQIRLVAFNYYQNVWVPVLAVDAA